MNNEYRSMGGALQESEASILSTVLSRVYLWMTGGLAVTAVAAWLTGNYLAGLSREQLASRLGMFWMLFVAEIVLVMVISWGINRLSGTAAGALFVLYSALNGVSLSPILLVYTQSSIAIAFGITAATFGAMSLYGYVTKSDLTGFGKLAFMALIGFLIGTVVNMFWANSTFYWLLSYLGVAIFVGLIAYDTQKIKALAYSLDDGYADGGTVNKAAVLGALTLYLDFINLLLLLLRFFGRRK